MGLFSFIKGLFTKAEQIEEAVETFVEQVEEIVPETKKVTKKAKDGIAKAKTATKKAKEVVIENEVAIEAVEAGKKFNSLQQRIRSQAKKLNLRVTIHFESSTSTLFFKASSEAKVSVEKSVPAKDVKSVKTVSKTNA